MLDYLKDKTIGFIGTGNMGTAFIKALINSNRVKSSNILATNRSPGKLKKLVEQLNIVGIENNEELIERSQIIVLGVKPQDFITSIESLSNSFNSNHILISLMAGVNLLQLSKVLPQVKNIVRAMPSTPAIIQKSVVGFCMRANSTIDPLLIEELLSPLGLVVKADEGDGFEALMVGCSSSVGFIYELMMYWQEWLEEHGFDKESARKMTVQTFLGTAMHAEVQSELSLQELQNKVVSKKGVTAAGLDSIRELEVERALRYSFEKSILRDRELGKDSIK